MNPTLKMQTDMAGLVILSDGNEIVKVVVDAIAVCNPISNRSPTIFRTFR